MRINKSKPHLFLLLLLVLLYVVLAVFSSSELNMNNPSYISLFFYGKIIIISILLLLKYINMKIPKFEFVILLLAMILSITLDSYLITISFFMLTGLAFSFIFEYGGVYKSSINLIFIISILTILGLHSIGVLSGIELIDEGKYAIGNKVSLGFSHPNKASILLVQVLLLAFCFKNRLVFFLSAIVYIYTFFHFAGRTALGGLVIFILLYLLALLPVWNADKYKKYIRWSFLFLHSSFPILLVFFISSGDWYIGDVNMNYVTNTRLSLMQELYNNNGGLHLYPVSIIGKIVDVGIANLLIGGGVLLYIGYVWCVNFYLKYENNMNLFLLMSSLLCMNFMENFINANMLASVILFARLIYIRRYSVNNLYPRL
ncbi:hypothetical protein X874_3130 [Mannheimia varigena USDA-ARS-USMARC-1312]|nr:hypothetical protein X874_3130 [Mannheimia varigena USDA-ARS-USMARC-1312]